jgi:hypothetical protein
MGLVFTKPSIDLVTFRTGRQSHLRGYCIEHADVSSDNLSTGYAQFDLIRLTLCPNVERVCGASVSGKDRSR